MARLRMEFDRRQVNHKWPLIPTKPYAQTSADGADKRGYPNRGSVRFLHYLPLSASIRVIRGKMPWTRLVPISVH